MPSEKSGNSILAARDRRGEMLETHLAQVRQALLFLSLNIPGAEKKPLGSGRLISWAKTLICGAFPEAEELIAGDDALGPFAIYHVNQEAVSVKQRCIHLENGYPAARLIDLDVFDRDGRQIGRSALGITPRSCLVCPLPAVNCMRLGRHPAREVISKTDELLAPFRD
jgi:holo-ACP synthase